MKVNSIKDVATLCMRPEQALRNPHIRYLHYMRNYLDYPEEFLVGYHGGILIFSDRFTRDEISEHEKLLKNFAKAKFLNSRGQDTRLKKIRKIFGKQGETAAMSLFKDCHKNLQTGKTKREKSEYLQIYLSDDDIERLFAIKENSSIGDLTPSQLAKRLLEIELQRLLPDLPARGEGMEKINNGDTE